MTHFSSIRKLLLGLLLICFASPTIVSSSELTFQFINPNFGGNPLNGSFLLGLASAQNHFEEDKSKNLLEDFEEQLNRRILSDISRKLTQDAFGEDLQSGSYILGDFTIDIDTGGADGITVDIVDGATGNSTIITVPRY